MSDKVKCMLAHNWDKHKAKVVYPCIVQPKLDGIRCLAHRVGSDIEFYSRAGNRHQHIDHLKAYCLGILDDGQWADGELYIHGMSFQNLCSLVKRSQLGTASVEYQVYDFISGENYDARMLRKFKAPLGTICNSRQDVDKMHASYVSAGFEGSMIRNLQGGYVNGRSFNLLKRKDWFDAEYQIVDVVEGKGKFTGCAIFVCKVGAGQFACTSPGSVDQKRWYWEQRAACIGKDLTVKYQELTDTGIPRFPIAINIRDYGLQG